MGRPRTGCAQLVNGQWKAIVTTNDGGRRCKVLPGVTTEDEARAEAKRLSDSVRDGRIVRRDHRRKGAVMSPSEVEAFRRRMALKERPKRPPAPPPIPRTLAGKIAELVKGRDVHDALDALARVAADLMQEHGIEAEATR